MCTHINIYCSNIIVVLIIIISTIRIFFLFLILFASGGGISPTEFIHSNENPLSHVLCIHNFQMEKKTVQRIVT